MLTVCFIIFFLFFPCFFYESLAGLEKSRIFAPQLRNQCNAQMAESVDALVSNTSGFTSIPVRPRVWVLINPDNRLIIRVYSLYKAY